MQDRTTAFSPLQQKKSVQGIQLCYPSVFPLQIAAKGAAGENPGDSCRKLTDPIPQLLIPFPIIDITGRHDAAAEDIKIPELRMVWQQMKRGSFQNCRAGPVGIDLTGVLSDPGEEGRNWQAFSEKRAFSIPRNIEIQNHCTKSLTWRQALRIICCKNFTLVISGIPWYFKTTSHNRGQKWRKQRSRGGRNSGLGGQENKRCYLRCVTAEKVGCLPLFSAMIIPGWPIQ